MAEEGAGPLGTGPFLPVPVCQQWMAPWSSARLAPVGGEGGVGQSHLLWLTRRPFFLNEGKDEVSLRLCRHPERSRAEHRERERAYTPG